MPSPTGPTAHARQLLLVVAPSWESCVGQLQRYARLTPEAAWQPVGEGMAVSLGRAGLGWGRGLHVPVAGSLRLKREGDGRAPAGVFAISSLFGEAAPDRPPASAAKLPYQQTTADLKAIDDPASRYYNRIVDQSRLASPDWRSCEDMRRADSRYVIGAVIDHNVEAVVPGAGSCIFLHVRAGAGVPTAGCTALALADMQTLASWLDAAAAPVLVQLPQCELGNWRTPWGLPSAVAVCGDSARPAG